VPALFQHTQERVPRLGGNYRVISHTELINDLIKDKRIKLSKVMNEKLTYHDPATSAGTTACSSLRARC